MFLSLPCNLLPTLALDNQEYIASVIIITNRHGFSSQKTHIFNNNLQIILTNTLRTLTLDFVNQRLSVFTEPRVKHRCFVSNSVSVPCQSLL